MWAYILPFLTFVSSVASMLLAGEMAGARHRSVKAWVWTAAFVGPLGPLALCLLGDRDREASPA